MPFLQDDIEMFIQHLARFRAAHTYEAYHRDLKKFLRHCKKNGLLKSDAVQTKDIQVFIGTLRKNGLARASIQRALSALRSFFAYLSEQDKSQRNPAKTAIAPKTRRQLPKVLDIDQMTQLLTEDGETQRDQKEAAKNLQQSHQAIDSQAARNQAILELLYSSGLRLSELTALNLRDINLKQGMARVLGKGGKERDVPVGRYAAQAIQRWLEARATMPNADSCAALFLSKRGTRISPRSVQLILKKHGLAKNLGQNLHPHMLRHSFASHLLESSGDLRAVQESLGHERITTTQIYTHLDFQHLAKTYDRTHPRANLRKKRSGDG